MGFTWPVSARPLSSTVPRLKQFDILHQLDGMAVPDARDPLRNDLHPLRRPVLRSRCDADVPFVGRCEGRDVS